MKNQRKDWLYTYFSPKETQNLNYQQQLCGKIKLFYIECNSTNCDTNPTLPNVTWFRSTHDETYISGQIIVALLT